MNSDEMVLYSGLACLVDHKKKKKVGRLIIKIDSLTYHGEDIIDIKYNPDDISIERTQITVRKTWGLIKKPGISVKIPSHQSYDFLIPSEQIDSIVNQKMLSEQKEPTMHSEALKLPQTRSYNAYQLSFQMKCAKQPASKCMHLAILTVLDWLESKTTDFPDEMKFYDENHNRIHADQFQLATDSFFRSIRYSSGFSLEISSLISEGVWAFKLWETDSDRNDRKAVIGRSFITEIAFRRMDDPKWISCGIRTTINEPVEAEELSYSYRPGIVRTFLLNPQLTLQQTIPFKYKQYIEIRDSDGIETLEKLLFCETSFLPVVVFTYEEAHQRIIDNISSKLYEAGINDTIPISFIRENRRLFHRIYTDKDPVIPFNNWKSVPDNTYGYGRTCIVKEKCFRAFSEWFYSHYHKEVNPGDVLFLEPKSISGNCNIYRLDFLTKPFGDSVIKEIQNQVFSFSKHKNVNFGSVLFADEAHKIEYENLLTRLRSKQDKDLDDIIQEVDGLVLELESLKKKKAELAETHNKDVDTIEQLKSELLKAQRDSTKANASKQFDSEEKNNDLIIYPELEELYEGEMHDLIVSVLKNADEKGIYFPKSRGEELLKEILKVNSMKGIGKVRFEQIINHNLYGI